jgi:hypothetical protein
MPAQRRSSGMWTIGKTEDAALEVLYPGTFEKRMEKKLGRPKALTPREVGKSIANRYGNKPSRNTTGNALRSLEEQGLVENVGSARHPHYRRPAKSDHKKILGQLLERAKTRERERDLRAVLEMMGVIRWWQKIPKEFRHLMRVPVIHKFKHPESASTFVGKDGVLKQAGLPGVYQVGPGTFWNLPREDLHRIGDHIKAIQAIWTNAIIRLHEEETRAMEEMMADASKNNEVDSLFGTTFVSAEGIDRMAKEKTPQYQGWKNARFREMITLPWALVIKWGANWGDFDLPDVLNVKGDAAGHEAAFAIGQTKGRLRKEGAGGSVLTPESLLYKNYYLDFWSELDMQIYQRSTQRGSSSQG